ncbi:MAG: Fic family protein [Sulfurimonadaceae bacterium]
MDYAKKWIWQQSEYPNFTYDKTKLDDLLLDVKYHQGVLNGIYSHINKDDLLQTQLEILTQDALDTSAIEGELLSRDSVRSSISKRLGIDIEANDSSTPSTDGLIDILLDATTHFKMPFSLKRLFGWHNALFPTGYSGLVEINVASFRGDDDMEIVSGPIGREKVHYVAPPRESLEKEVDHFLAWFNNDEDVSIIKAGIAHLWFVIIHPLDDGNGRIARAITDMLLAKEANQPLKFFSISSAIKNDRKRYYEVLEKTTSGTLDITMWLVWFLETLLASLKSAKMSIEFILQKTAFWDRHRNTVLNERQIKVLNRLLDAESGNFEGGINTRKYVSLTKVSKPTASRELKDLLEKECIIQRAGTSGRSISYEVNTPIV